MHTIITQRPFALILKILQYAPLRGSFDKTLSKITKNIDIAIVFISKASIFYAMNNNEILIYLLKDEATRYFE
ncbi:hypothetical protein D5018_20640 [Parashewanella curva]|uniref:Uncharacterized protein n=1 Tax=Parashewanella curva TaxID=2338552 RepID=A0A3L8PQZ5_9GAMM|nr:hypothetical protein D5018_20640 [Parashewanella curva]